MIIRNVKGGFKSKLSFLALCEMLFNSESDVVKQEDDCY